MLLLMYVCAASAVGFLGVVVIVGAVWPMYVIMSLRTGGNTGVVMGVGTVWPVHVLFGLSRLRSV